MRTGLSRYLVSTAPIFPGCHAGRTMERARKTGLRRELRFERYLRDRQFARRQFRHRLLQPQAAYVVVWRNAHGERELARKMKRAVTRVSSEIDKTDVVLDV